MKGEPEPGSGSAEGPPSAALGGAAPKAGGSARAEPAPPAAAAEIHLASCGWEAAAGRWAPPYRREPRCTPPPPSPLEVTPPRLPGRILIAIFMRC